MGRSLIHTPVALAMAWATAPSTGSVPFHLDFGQVSIDLGGNLLTLKKLTGTLEFDSTNLRAKLVFRPDECPIFDFKTLGGLIHVDVPIFEVGFSRTGIDIKHRFGIRHIDIT